MQFFCIICKSLVIFYQYDPLVTCVCGSLCLSSFHYKIPTMHIQVYNGSRDNWLSIPGYKIKLVPPCFVIIINLIP